MSSMQFHNLFTIDNDTIITLDRYRKFMSFHIVLKHEQTVLDLLVLNSVNLSNSQIVTSPTIYVFKKTLYNVSIS